MTKNGNVPPTACCSPFLFPSSCLYHFWSWLRPEARSLKNTLWETCSGEISSSIHERQKFEYISQEHQDFGGFGGNNILSWVSSTCWGWLWGPVDYAAANNCLGERKVVWPPSNSIFPVIKESPERIKTLLCFHLISFLRQQCKSCPFTSQRFIFPAVY